MNQIQALINDYKKDMIELDRLIHKRFLANEVYEEMRLSGKKIMLYKVVKDLEGLLK